MTFCCREQLLDLLQGQSMDFMLLCSRWGDHIAEITRKKVQTDCVIESLMEDRMENVHRVGRKPFFQFLCVKGLNLLRRKLQEL
jgi:hypothetical protein